MPRIRLTCFATAALLVALAFVHMACAAPAVATTQSTTGAATTPSTHPATTPAMSGVDKRAPEVQRLHERSIELAKVKNWAEARDTLLRLIEIAPHDSLAMYNLACFECRLGNNKSALDYLDKAVGDGWNQLRHMENDDDLEPLRTLPRFQDILKHRDEIQRKHARQVYDELRATLGGDYIFAIDEPSRLVFATNTDDKTLQEMKTYLTTYAEAQWKALFGHRFDRYVIIVLPTPQKAAAMMSPMIGGFYSNNTNTLVARSLGSVLTHEFTHALHFADQESLGQEHPLWVTEGLATLFETSQLIDGRFVPQPNNRLMILKQTIARDKLVPFKEFVGYTHPQFMAKAMISYCECRYIMAYLYDKGILKRWYDTYVQTYTQDKTGGLALEKVLGKPLPEIQKDWVAWVTALPNPTLVLPADHARMGVAVTGVSDGIKITQVAAGSGAARAGLKVGDVITHLGGQRMVDAEDLTRLVGTFSVGDQIEVEFRRDGQYKTVQLTLTALTTTARPAAATRPQSQPVPAAK